MIRTDPPDDDVASDETEAAEALGWMRRARTEGLIAAAVQRKVRRRRARRLAMASAILCAVVTVGLFLWNSLPTAPSATAIVTTPLRETLPDGSIVELKTGARIAVEFASTVRRVRLVEGEAHFQVAKNPARPFVVTAGDVDVVAVGTAFTVEHAAGAVEVLVTEGRVAVDAAKHTVADQSASVFAPAAGESNGEPLPARSPVATPPSSAVFLDAGHRVTIEPSMSPASAPVIAAVPAVEIAARLAWRVPQLEFARTPLAEAVELMNGYAATSGGPRFVIASDSVDLSDVRLNGFLRADNVAGLVYLLDAHSGVRAEWRGDSEIVLRAAR